jgi:hypothetical protein
MARGVGRGFGALCNMRHSIILFRSSACNWPDTDSKSLASLRCCPQNARRGRLALASGGGDSLSGRFLSIWDDLDSLRSFCSSQSESSWTIGPLTPCVQRSQGPRLACPDSPRPGAVCSRPSATGTTPATNLAKLDNDFLLELRPLLTRSPIDTHAAGGQFAEGFST